MHEVEVPRDSNDEDGDFFIGVVNKSRASEDEISVNFEVENSGMIKAQLRTGAQVNVMAVQLNSSTKSKVLKPTKVKITAYGGIEFLHGFDLCALKCKFKNEIHTLGFWWSILVLRQYLV